MRPETPADYVTLLAGGDVGPVVQPVDRLADLLLPVLEEADLRFAQCERTYSHRGAYRQWGTTESVGNSRLPPEYASIFKTAQFDVVSVASNHAMDCGPEALLDTIELLRGMGIHPVGAGSDIAEARRPVILERKGVRIAFLAYCSVLHPGSAAGDGLPGIAPMRARTFYEPVDFFPGHPPRIHTEAIPHDLEDLKNDIRRAKLGGVHAVVVSHHWGFTRFAPKIVFSYQIEVAHAAIDAGADVILGHHPHIPQAIEVYKGKVCFYSIGNMFTTGRSAINRKKPSARWNLFWDENPAMRDPSVLYALPEECKQTIFPKIYFSKGGVERVSFLPAYINDTAQPEIFGATHPRFQQVLEWMEWVSEQYSHQFQVSGDEVVVEMPSTSGT